MKNLHTANDLGDGGFVSLGLDPENFYEKIIINIEHSTFTVQGHPFKRGGEITTSVELEEHRHEFELSNEQGKMIASLLGEDKIIMSAKITLKANELTTVAREEAVSKEHMDTMLAILGEST